MHSTSRLALNVPDVGDNISSYPTVSGQQMTALDVAVRYFSGTISNRGTVVSSPIDGDEYRATDTGLVYKYNGTAWVVLPVAGAWTTLTLGTNVTSTGYTPSARLEGDIVRLKGTLTWTTVGFTSGSTIATIPTGLRPSSSVRLATTIAVSSDTATSAAAQLLITTGGVVSTLPTGLNYGPVTIDIPLDGQLFSLS